MSRIIIVTGGRTYGVVPYGRTGGDLLAARTKAQVQRSHVNSVLDELHHQERIDLLVQGGAKGADYVSKEWALTRGVHVLTCPAHWERDGRAAGPIRNADMAKRGAEAVKRGDSVLVVAFPGGAGTKNMIQQAHRAGLLTRHESEALASAGADRKR